MSLAFGDGSGVDDAIPSSEGEFEHRGTDGASRSLPTPSSRSVLPPLSADMVLLHAPAVFDFRERRDLYFPFLGTSGDVPITPLYEYFPIGFKTLQRFLSGRGHDVKIVNLSSVLLRFPTLDVDLVIQALDTRVVGIDLHWMVHVQGSLDIARRIHQLRPDIAIIFGGISSTYYAQELIRYPFIDMVMQGYDTHQSVAQLLDAVGAGRPPAGVPNLLWKDAAGNIQDNGFTHLPDSFGCGIDWSGGPNERKGAAAPELLAGTSPTRSLPVLEFLSTQNAGCAYNCGWCGGSREAFRRIFKRKRAMARRPAGEVDFEFATIRNLSEVEKHHFYSVGSYNESPERLSHFLDLVGESGLKSISYEQFFLTPDPVLKQMARANRRTSITLSPESHDPEVARLAGRGVYTNAEMEAWIGRALDAGIHQIDIWYFVGMPKQTPESVWGTVSYCQHLLTKFKGLRVNPMICPMIPFLDPASTFFVDPDSHGYRIFHRTAEQHRRGMMRASILNRLNYETRWLSRQQLVEVGFRAVRELMLAKEATGALPQLCVRDYNGKIDDALSFIPVVDAADNLECPTERARELERLGDEILARNNMVLFGGVMNQAFPLNRHIGQRWVDELGWDEATLAACAAATGSSWERTQPPTRAA